MFVKENPDRKKKVFCSPIFLGFSLLPKYFAQDCTLPSAGHVFPRNFSLNIMKMLPSKKQVTAATSVNLTHQIK